MQILFIILVGILSGWLASQIMKEHSSLVRNLIIGIVGSFIGSFALGAVGISFHGLVGNVIGSTIGAVILLFLIRAIKK